MSSAAAAIGDKRLNDHESASRRGHDDIRSREGKHRFPTPRQRQNPRPPIVQPCNAGGCVADRKGCKRTNQYYTHETVPWRDRTLCCASARTRDHFDKIKSSLVDRKC